MLFISAGAANATQLGLPQVDSPEMPVIIPSEPSISAKSWVLMDAASGHVITQHEANKPLPPASLTKLMTAYLIEHEIDAGNLSLSDDVLISEKAWRKGGSKMFVEVGKRVSVDDLLHGIVIVSGNDASIAMAEHLAGSEASFADVMNQHAAYLGLQNTHFENATGWPAENHYSSAYDMASLARHIINDYPEHYRIYSQESFTYNGITQANRNKLLKMDDSVDGLKTGWTQEAGYGLVSSAKRDDMRLVSVVFGAKSPDGRVQETQKLLNYGFRFYDTVNVAEKGAVLSTQRVWGGLKTDISGGLSHDAIYTVPRHQVSSVSQQLEMLSDLEAPIKKGQQIGTLVITVDGDELAKEPVVALESIEKAGMLKVWTDKVVRFFTGLFS